MAIKSILILNHSGFDSDSHTHTHRVWSYTVIMYCLQRGFGLGVMFFFLLTALCNTLSSYSDSQSFWFWFWFTHTHTEYGPTQLLCTACKEALVLGWCFFFLLTALCNTLSSPHTQLEVTGRVEHSVSRSGSRRFASWRTFSTCQTILAITSPLPRNFL